MRIEIAKALDMSLADYPHMLAMVPGAQLVHRENIGGRADGFLDGRMRDREAAPTPVLGVTNWHISQRHGQLLVCLCAKRREHCYGEMPVLGRTVKQAWCVYDRNARGR